MSGLGKRRCCCGEGGVCQYGLTYSDSAFTSLGVYEIDPADGDPDDVPNFYESSGRLRCYSQSDPYDTNEDDGYAHVEFQMPTGSGWTITISAQVWGINDSNASTDHRIGIGLGPGDLDGPDVQLYIQPFGDFGDYVAGTEPESGGTLATQPLTYDSSTGTNLKILVTDVGSGNVEYKKYVDTVLKVTATRSAGDHYNGPCMIGGMFCINAGEWDSFEITAVNGT